MNFAGVCVRMCFIRFPPRTLPNRCQLQWPPQLRHRLPTLHPQFPHRLHRPLHCPRRFRESRRSPPNGRSEDGDWCCRCFLHGHCPEAILGRTALLWSAAATPPSPLTSPSSNCMPVLNFHRSDFLSDFVRTPVSPLTSAPPCYIHAASLHSTRHHPSCLFPPLGWCVDRCARVSNSESSCICRPPVHRRASNCLRSEVVVPSPVQYKPDPLHPEPSVPSHRRTALLPS